MRWVALHCQLAVFLTDAIEASYPTWGTNQSEDIDREGLERDAIQLMAAERQLDKWYTQASAIETSGNTAECVLVSQSMAYIFY